MIEYIRLDDENEIKDELENKKVTKLKINNAIAEKQHAINTIYGEIIEMMKKYKKEIRLKFRKPRKISRIRKLITEMTEQGKTSFKFNLLDIPREDYFLKKYNNYDTGIFTIVKKLFVGTDINTEKNVKSALEKVFKTLSADAKIEMIHSKNVCNVMKYQLEKNTQHAEYLNLGILLAYNELKAKWCKKIFDKFLEGYNVRFIACDFIPSIVVRISWEKLHDGVNVIEDSGIYHHDKKNIWVYE